MNYKVICGEKKRPGGKLVKVCLKIHEKNEIQGALITGDFFTNAELFDELNEELSKLRIKKEDATNAILNKIKEMKIKIIGINIEEIKKAIEKALQNSDA